MGALPYFSKRMKLFLLTAAVLMILLIIVDVTGFGREYLTVSVTLSEDSDTGRAAFLADYGWEVSTIPLEVTDVVIPSQFNQVYEQYNDLQRSQGFDLSKVRGKTVKRYTYAILNYPQQIEGVRANLLVYQGKVVGGDVCTVALGGFMHGFEREDHGLTHQAVWEMIDQ